MAAEKRTPDPEGTFIPGAAPEATQIGAKAAKPFDADATYIPAADKEDAEATRLIAPKPQSEVLNQTVTGSGEETVMHRAASAPSGEETVMFRPNAEPQRPTPADEPQAEPDPEATALFIPTPGRKRVLTPPAESAAAPAGNVDAAEEQLATLVGLNPLVAAANRLLSAVPQIRASLRHSDPTALCNGLVTRINEFHAAALAKGYPERTVLTARYALCALIDESALHTPWGSAAHWEKDGLLQRVEAEPAGESGDKFFSLLEEAEQNPVANLELLEFFAVCLALGFEGRFRITAAARAQLEPVAAKVQGLIKAKRGSNAELSLRWKGLDVPLRRRSPWFTTWVSACVCAAVLVSVYLGLRIVLATSAEPAAHELASLRAKIEPVASSKDRPAVSRLKVYLDKEIQEGKLALQEDGARSVVTISGDELFTSGSDLIEERYIPTVLRVAQALNKVPGTITIAGHTDDKPIRSARFPSNWDLSRERALTVMKMMSGEIADPARLRAEGLADSEPLVPNDSATDRARNRRVTMILRVAS